MPSRPHVIGVTGNIAVGKSTVLNRLAERGAAVIDADRVYHELIGPSAPLNGTLVKTFGAGIRNADGTINRRALADIVFANPVALARLDEVTHPSVVAEIGRLIVALDAPMVAVDAVKLFEAGLDRLCDEVWLVTAPPERQITRLMARNNLSREEASRRVQAQPPVAEKRLRADVVVDNGGDIEHTWQLIDAGWDAAVLRAALSDRTIGDPS